MTYNKITETEFKNWTEDFEKIYLARLARMPESEEKEKQREAIVRFIDKIKSLS